MVARRGLDRPIQVAEADARALAVLHRTKGSPYEHEWVDKVQVDMPLKLDEIQGNVVAGFNKD